MRQKKYIASCSFGKDSIATILLALENNEPLDRVVFAEVMFDHKKGISGEIPEHIDWVYNVAIPKLAEMGVKVDWALKSMLLERRRIIYLCVVKSLKAVKTKESAMVSKTPGLATLTRI